MTRSYLSVDRRLASRTIGRILTMRLPFWAAVWTFLLTFCVAAGGSTAPVNTANTISPFENSRASASPSTTERLSDTHQFAKRAVTIHFPLGGEWHNFFSIFEPVVPMLPASIWFERLYRTIEQNVTPGGLWFPLPEHQVFTIYFGQIRVHFHSDFGPVHWLLVADWARFMIAQSQRGFAGRYAFKYWHQPTRMSITIWLTFAPMLRY